MSDLDRVIAETARVLRPGGLYLFDTTNRTAASKVLAIKMMQEWRLTRIVDTELHSWDMFIKPREFCSCLGRRGMRLNEVTGLGPRSSMVSVLWSFAQARRGRISFGELSRRMDAGR
jgi:2-polyprenyl-6-hydroxyphenyl methylase/3-demethylubiquinone-9 3-methyltransferase